MEDEDAQLHDRPMLSLKSCMEMVIIKNLHGGKRREWWGSCGLNTPFEAMGGNMKM